MFDSIYNLPQASSLLIAFDIAFYAFIIFALRIQSKIKTQRITHTIINITILTIFCIFSFYDTDWFSYLTIFNTYDYEYLASDLADFSFKKLYEVDTLSHLEYIYILLIKVVEGNYLLFRLCVWGSAVYILALIAKRMEVDSISFYLIFVFCFLVFFCYGRVSLAYSIIFLGFSLIAKPLSNPKISTILGLFFIAISTIFHKSAIIITPVLLMSLLPFNKKTLILLTFVLIPASFVINTIMNYVLSIGNEENITLHTFQVYNDIESKTRSGSLVKYILSDYLVYLPYYLFIVGIIKQMKNGDFYLYPRCIQYMVSSACWICIFASALLITGNHIMFYRILLYSIIPISITLTYQYQHSPNAIRMVRATVSCGLIMSIYRLTYVYYLAIMNGF